MRTTSLVIVAIFCLGSSVVTGEPMELPLAETFSGNKLDPAWTVDAAEGNAVTVKDGELLIAAKQNTFAHLERPLGTDLIQARVEYWPSAGVSWAPAVVLYWNERNWAMFSVLDLMPPGDVGVWYGGKGGGQFLVNEMIDGQLSENIVAMNYARHWHRVAIELAEDGVRYQCSTDGKLWVALRTVRRPKPWQGAPKLLIVGKGWGDPKSYPKPDLDNDYADPGPPTTTRIREVSVVATPDDPRQQQGALRRL